MGSRLVYTYVYLLIYTLACVRLTRATENVLSVDDCWQSTAPIAGGPRQEHAVVAIRDEIYILGGFKGASTTDAVEKYSIQANTWSLAAPLPVAVHHANVAVVGGELYLLGSLKNGVASGVAWPPVAATYKYNPSSNNWTEIAVMPNPRGSSVIGVLGTTVYIAGGLSGMGKAVDTVSSFDTRTNQWKSLSNLKLPERTDHAGGGILDGKLYIVGGRKGNVTSLRRTAWVYDLSIAEGRWQNLASMPTARGGAAVAFHNAQIYVFGGEGNVEAQSHGVFSTVESLNTATGIWIQQGKMKVPRHGNGAVTVKDLIYIPGGGLQQSGGKATSLSDAYRPGSCLHTVGAPIKR